MSLRISQVGCALLAVACCLGGPAAAGRKEAAPYDVVVRVEYEFRAGAESMREWAEREIVRELDESGCFRSVAGFDAEHPGQADLLLRVVVENFEEKKQYETSLAQRDDPHTAPMDRLRYVASLEIWGHTELCTFPGRRPVRSRALHLTRGFRPLFGEDAEYEVRRLLIEALGDETRVWACKGARKKLPREIEQALGDDPAR